MKSLVLTSALLMAGTAFSMDDASADKSHHVYSRAYRHALRHKVGGRHWRHLHRHNMYSHYFRHHHARHHGHHHTRFAYATVAYVPYAYYVKDFSNTISVSGTGEWKSRGGQGGTYGVAINVSKVADNQATITESYNFGSSSKEFSYSVVKTDDNFFNVFSVAGESIGNGYCFLKQEAGIKACHMYVSTKVNGHKLKSEKTLEVDLNSGKVYRMGSIHYRGETYIYNDALSSTESTPTKPTPSEPGQSEPQQQPSQEPGQTPSEPAQTPSQK